MIIYTIFFLLSFFLVYLLIPVTTNWAKRLDLVDRPNWRKIHRVPVPLSGGLAVYLGITLTILLLSGWSPLHLVVVIGGIPLILAGLLDDRFKAQGRDFPAWPKFLVQFAVAVFVFYSGIRLDGISNFLGLQGFHAEYIPFPAWLSFLTTILWITGMINMINFLDGVDGLAGGVTAIAGVTLFLIAYIKDQSDTAILAAILVGGSLAFLRHNFHPALIFLGDAGAMFLGFVISVISLYGAVKSATLFSVIITVLALGVPVFDTLQVMISRLKEGMPIYKADKRHFHHRLLQLGLSQKQTVYVLYMISLFFSLISLLLMFLLL